MPAFIIEEGIKVECYSGEHLPAHIHVRYSGDEVLILIEDQTVLAGKMPQGKLKKVIAFVKKNKEDLLFLFFELNQHLKKENENK